MERAADLEDLTRAMYDAIGKGDIAFFERRVARTDALVFIGTAPGEWWSDPAALLEAMRAQMRAAGAAVELVAGDLRAHREGEVGWVADRPTLRVGDVAVSCRHTSVFVRAQGEWTIVQQHFSIAVENETAFGADAARLG